MPKVRVRDVELYYEIHGAGPPLLNISGSGNDLRRSMPGTSPLNDHFTVLHFDQRGLGQATNGKSDVSMADFADDAAALVAELGWDHCHVVGTSFGGMVALHLAIRHPALIDRLVLNCTSAGGSQPSYPIHELENLPGAERAEAWMRLLDTRYDAEADEPIPGLGPIAGFIRAAHEQERDEVGELGAQRQMEARRHHDVEAELPTISVPTLVCAGTYDGIAPVPINEAIVSRLPNASLEVFEGGHLFLLQDPRAFVTIIDHLSSTLRPGLLPPAD